VLVGEALEEAVSCLRPDAGAKKPGVGETLGVRADLPGVVDQCSQSSTGGEGIIERRRCRIEIDGDCVVGRGELCSNVGALLFQ
jgi:hypothetical protein